MPIKYWEKIHNLIQTVLNHYQHLKILVTTFFGLIGVSQCFLKTN
jgi:hypothetical protein